MESISDTNSQISPISPISPIAAESPDHHVNLRLTALRSKRNESMKKYFATHPEQAAKKSARVCKKYLEDPVYREKVKASTKRAYAKNKAAIAAAVVAAITAADVTNIV